MSLNISKILCMSFFLLLFLSGCATLKSDFEQAKRIDSIQAYDEFLKKYPNSEFSNQALIRMEELLKIQEKIQAEEEKKREEKKK